MQIKALGTLLLLLLFTSPVLAQTQVIKFSSPDELESLLAPAKNYLGKLIEERSGGRVQVELQTHTQNNRAAHLQGLLANQVELSLCNIDLLREYWPQLRLLQIPFLFESRRHLYAVLESEIGDQLFLSTAPSGFTPLALWDRGFRQLLSNRQPKREIPGLQLTAEGRLSSDPEKQQGETTAFKLLDVELQQLTQWSEATEYRNLALSRHAVSGELLLANQSFWQQLPRDLQVIIKGAVKDATRYARELSLQREEQLLKKIALTGHLAIRQPTVSQRRLWSQQAQAAQQQNPTDRSLIRLAERVRSSNMQRSTPE